MSDYPGRHILVYRHSGTALKQYSGRKKRKSCVPCSNSWLQRSLPTPFSRSKFLAMPASGWN